MANTLSAEGFIPTIASLDRMLIDNPRTATAVRKIVSDVLTEARNKVSAGIRSALPTDPRMAFRAVRRSVYKQVFGGNINILNNRRAGALIPMQMARKMDRNPFQRGGNRRRPSQRTINLQSYQGKDRGFILRFLNSGTTDRNAYDYGSANRGSIAARNFFQGMAEPAIQEAASRLSELIDQEIEKQFNA